MTRGIDLSRAARLDLLGGLTEAVLVAAIDRVGRRAIAVVDVARGERSAPVAETVGDDRQIAPAFDHPGLIEQRPAHADVAVAPGEQLTASIAQARRRHRQIAV